MEELPPGHSQESRPRNVINNDLARYIFSCRPIEKAKPTISSSILSMRVGITPKAIRDIWRRRTWVRATLRDWTLQERNSYQGGELRSHCLHNVKGETSLCSECQRIKRHRGDQKMTHGHANQVGEDVVSSDSEDSEPANSSELMMGGSEIIDEEQVVADQQATQPASSHHDGWLFDAALIGYFISN
eukprot:768598-Hanusia_phi.AAC.1